MALGVAAMIETTKRALDRNNVRKQVIVNTFYGAFETKAKPGSRHFGARATPLQDFLPSAPNCLR
jgi:hypothetical protein